MSRLLWMPEVLRAAGLTVHEVPGWRTRGADSFGPVVGITCHATAGSRTSTDAGEISVLLNGSTSAPPPIAQLYLSRTGHWHVVASGTCFHNKVGWGGPNQGHGNDALLGIEAQNDNRGEPWSAHMLDSYQRGVAALCRRLGVPASRVAAHREHQPGSKTDPHGISMTQFRARVAALLAGEDDDMTPQDLINTRLGSPALGDKTVGDWWKQAEAARREAAAARADLAAFKTDVGAALAGLDAQLTAVKAAVEAGSGGSGGVTLEMHEEALRRVLGSVDGATPPE